MHTLNRTLITLLAGYAVWRLGGDWREYQLQRRQATPLAKPREETRWEGEGGALHDGPQTQVGQVGQKGQGSPGGVDEDEVPGTRH